MFIKQFKLINFIYLFSLFIYGLLIFKVTKMQDNNFATHIAIGLSILFVCYWLTFLLKPATRLQFHIISTSLVISLFLAEYFIEMTGIFIPRNLIVIRNDYIKEKNILFDNRSKYEVIKDYRESKVQAYPSIHPHNEFLEGSLTISNQPLFPIAGISNVKTILCNENGRFSEYISDKYGFNNPNNVYDQKVDIVLIGDSIVHGSCVSPEENIRQQLANKGNGNLVNLGMGGAGPLLELAALVEYASAIKPRIVLWMFAETNDLADLSNEQKDDILNSYLDPHFSQSLIQKQKSIDLALSEYVDSKLKSHQDEDYLPDAFWNTSVKNVLLLRHLRYRLGLYNKISPQPFNEFEQVLLIAKQRVESWGGQLIFVYLPSYPSQAHRRDPALEYIYKNVLNITGKLELPTIDLKLALESAEDPPQYYPFRLPGHFTPAGYEVLSTYISDYLKQYESEKAIALKTTH